MRKSLALFASVIFVAAVALPRAQAPVNVNDIVELELLTHTEVYDKIHNQGFTSVLIVTGGTEERGPHDVLGGHTIMLQIRRPGGTLLLVPRPALLRPRALFFAIWSSLSCLSCETIASAIGGRDHGRVLYVRQSLGVRSSPAQSSTEPVRREPFRACCWEAGRVSSWTRTLSRRKRARDASSLSLR